MPDIQAIGAAPALSAQTAGTDRTRSASKPDGELDADHQKLRKATREMESFFVGMLLKKMHESAVKGGLFDQKSDSATYRDMFDDAVAHEIGKQGAFGIADTLYREMLPHLEGSKP